MLDIILTILGVGIILLLWVAVYDTTHFQTTEYRVTDPRIKEPWKAVVLADLHNNRYGRDNHLLVEKIRECRPDVILVAGDMLTARPKADPTPALDLVKTLAADYDICYGNGNHEHRIKLYPEVYGDLAQVYAQGLMEAGVQPLVNEKKCYPEKGITVVGSEIHREYYKRFQKHPMDDGYLDGLLGKKQEDEFTVLLAHNPDYFPEYAAWGADLVLSGHVHGGVVRIPFWKKGVISPAIRLLPTYDGGLFERGKSKMLLSRGLGCHTIPIRVFNPGDLIVLDFMPAAEYTVEKRTRKRSGNMVK